MSTTLNYKASNIAKAESALDKNFFKVISSLSSSPSMGDLLFLYAAGGGTEEEFDATFAEGVDAVMLAIFEGINNAGFLGEKIDLEALRAEMQKAMKQPKTKTSPDTGAKTNA